MTVASFIQLDLRDNARVSLESKASTTESIGEVISRHSETEKAELEDALQAISARLHAQPLDYLEDVQGAKENIDNAIKTYTTLSDYAKAHPGVTVEVCIRFLLCLILFNGSL